MHKQLFLGSLVLASLFALQPYSAKATTITFTENGDGPVIVNLNLAGCAGCTPFIAQGAVETGVAGYTVPGGFAGFPAGLTTAQAFVVEAAGDDSLAGAISDSVIVQIQNTPGVIASVLANFTSNSDDVTTFPPPNVPTVPDTSHTLDLTNSFVTQTSTGFSPLVLPGDLKIEVGEVPEPGTAALLTTGLVAWLSTKTWRRKRSA